MPRGFVAALGEALARHRRTIIALQWAVVVFYFGLLIISAWVPIPEEDAHIWSDLRLFAQFVFWGLWWPGVMLSTILLGRMWCGVFCPEGALSEWASGFGRGKPVPRWIKWSGWPFVAFVCTTVYGQLISVYEYAEAALLILGGSSVAAVLIGLLYGRGHRVWCRHLCPASGVFALLARIAPLYYRVDRAAWDRNNHTGHGTRGVIPIKPVDCAPLVDIRRMTSAAECHSCGRCAGHRDAVEFAARLPGAEVVDLATPARTAEAGTLLFGVLGVATLAFQWTISPYFLRMKIAMAEWLVDHDMFWPLQDNAPWWVLTHYPRLNDVFTWLDGALILAYILAGGALLGAGLWCCVALAARIAANARLSWQRLTLALIPLGGVNVVLGLTMLTLSQLRAERIQVPGVDWMRGGLMALAVVWSFVLVVGLLHRAGGNLPRRVGAGAVLLVPMGVMAAIWHAMFFIW